MSGPPTADAAGFLCLQGRGTAPGAACGPLRRNRIDLTPDEVEGCILAAVRAVPDDVGRILAARGTLTIAGAMLSHVSLLSREFGRPSVALGEAARVSILDGREAGLLALGDVVGRDAPAVLHEGDVVLLDGTAGTLRVPGGLDPEARRAIRSAHARLAAYARLPEDPTLLASVIETPGDPDGPVVAYMVEAALLYGLVPRGGPTRRLVSALDADAARSGPLRRALESIRERVGARARARCEQAQVTLADVEDIDELERALREFEGALGRELALLDDLDESAESLEADLDAVLQVAAARRGLLRERIEAEVAEALAAPDDALATRLGSLFRILRRARMARLDEDRIARLHARLTQRLAEERAKSGSDLVIPLDDRAPRDRSLVGGKAAGLIDVRGLLPDGCALPRGFVVTSSAYRLHLLGEVGEKLHRAITDGTDEAAVSRRARAAILSGPIPAEIRTAIASAWDALGRSPLAVRSSATIEDAPAGSLAGLFDSYLGVSGLDNVLEKVRWAWASLWNARALATLATAGLSPLRAAQSVLVQEMVPTRAAGVLFSRDPGGRADTVLINATWGLGEGVSQGEVSGDLYWVKRSTGRLVASDIEATERWIVLDPSGGGTLEAPLAPHLRGRPCLDEDDLGRLAALARALEEGTGRSQDAEFGFGQDGSLFVFQVRRVVPRRPR